MDRRTYEEYWGTPSTDDAGAHPSGAAGPSEPVRFVAVGPARRAACFFGWIAACLGVIAAYLAASVAGALLLDPLAVRIAELVAGGASSAVFAAEYDNWYSIAVQVSAIALFAPWWRYLAPRSCASLGRAPRDAAPLALARRCGGIVLLGLSLQIVISVALTLASPLLPDLMGEYDEMMDSSGTSLLSVSALLVLCVGAPVLEELMCRGVMFEFALRAVCPEWRARWQSGGALFAATADLPAIPTARFWLANAIQALAFGALHVNPVQVAYASALGMVFGYVYRRGGLRCSMLLHAVVNAASFLVEPLWDLLAPLGTTGTIVVPVAVAIAGMRLFLAGTTHAEAPHAEAPHGRDGVC